MIGLDFADAPQNKIVCPCGGCLPHSLFYTKVKPKLEGLTAPAAKDKKRHSLRRRVLRYVTAGDVVRTKVEFVGLEGEVMANHSFRGKRRLGELEVRWLPCACKGCFRDTPGGSCEQAEFNTPSKDLGVCMATAVNTKSSDERIQERAAGLRRRLKSVRGGCNGTLAALFWNAGAGQEQWGLAELAGAPRDRAAGDVLGGVQMRSKSAKPADAVVPVRCFESVVDTSGKGRRLFRQPAAENCAKFTHDGCTCGKWHVELQPFLSVRPPFVATTEKSFVSEGARVRRRRVRVVGRPLPEDRLHVRRRREVHFYGGPRPSACLPGTRGGSAGGGGGSFFFLLFIFFFLLSSCSFSSRR